MNDKMPLDVGQIRIDLNECEAVQCPECKDVADCITYTLEIELKHVSAIKVGREMYVPVAYLTCTNCEARLVMNDQLVVINLSGQSSE